jgi:hypothetical protein
VVLIVSVGLKESVLSLVFVDVSCYLSRRSAETKTAVSCVLKEQ